MLVPKAILKVMMKLVKAVWLLTAWFFLKILKPPIEAVVKGSSEGIKKFFKVVIPWIIAGILAWVGLAAFASLPVQRQAETMDMAVCVVLLAAALLWFNKKYVKKHWPKAKAKSHGGGGGHGGGHGDGHGGGHH